MPKSSGGMIDGSPITPRISLLPDNVPANVHVLGIVSSDVISQHFFKKGKTITKEVYLSI